MVNLQIPVYHLQEPLQEILTNRLTEDHVPAVLQGEAGGDGGGAVLHQQEHHGLFGLVTHQRGAVCQRGE